MEKTTKGEVRMRLLTDEYVKQCNDSILKTVDNCFWSEIKEGIMKEFPSLK